MSEPTTTLVSSTTTLQEAMSAVELVKEHITNYDTKSSQYKTSLRTITAAISATTPKEPNTVTIEWVKVTFSIVVVGRRSVVMIHSIVTRRHLLTHHHAFVL